MEIKELQNLAVGKVIVFHAGGKVFGDDSMQNQYFTVKKILSIEKPKIRDHYWTDSDNFGPAKKIILEHYKTKKEFFIIVPLDFEKENYIYFDNENHDIGDSIPSTHIEEFKKS